MKILKSIAPVLLLLGLSVFASAPGLASELTITPYQASYRFYKNGMQVAKSSLALEQSGDFWRWRLSTKPRGIYKFFSDKNPYSETTFSRLDQRYRIHNILLADEGNEKLYETARFNWNSHQADVQRKGKRQFLDLPEQVYDFLTIHLLIAQMTDQSMQQIEFNFYLKGEIHQSKIVRGDMKSVEIEGKSIETTIYHQTIAGLKTSSNYFVSSDHHLLPLKIENINSKGKASIMILRQVVWL